MNFLNTTAFLISLLFVLPLCSATDECTHTIGEWKQKAPIPTVHYEGASAVASGKLVVVSGYTSKDIVSPEVWYYDITNDTWTSGPPLGTPVTHVQGATDGRYVWIGGGFKNNTQPTNKVWVLDTVANEWQALPGLPEPRSSSGVAIHEQRLHVISGLKDRNKDTPTHWTLDLENTTLGWQNATSQNFPTERKRNHFQAVTINGIIYAVGGQFNHDEDPQDLPYLDAFDTATAIWTPKSDLPHNVSHAEGGTLTSNGRILVLGGKKNPKENLDTIYEYNPEVDSWTLLGYLPVPFLSSYSGILSNVQVDGEQGDFLVLVNRPTYYNNKTNATYVAKISFNCLETEGTSTSTASDTSTTTTNSAPLPTTVDDENNSHALHPMHYIGILAAFAFYYILSV